ncbi:hypothetical protein [Natrarchaeobius oligotrophus]
MDEQNTALTTLVGSPIRVRVLRELVRSQKNISELESRVNATRRTIIRNLNQLETEGWIHQTDGRYYVRNTSGELIERLLDLFERADHVRNLNCVLENMPVDTIDVESKTLLECDVIVRKPSCPGAPIEQTVDLIQASTQVYTFLPTVTRQLVDAHGSSLHKETQLK